MPTNSHSRTTTFISSPSTRPQTVTRARGERIRPLGVDVIEEALHHGNLDLLPSAQRHVEADVNLTFTTLARLSEGFEVDVAQLFQPLK